MSIPATRGNPTVPIGIGRSMLALCLDIGGMKVAAGLADLGGVLVHTVIRRILVDGGAEQVWNVIAGTLCAAYDVVSAVVSASAGLVNLHSGHVSPINTGCWRGFPLCDSGRCRDAECASTTRWRRCVYVR